MAEMANLGLATTEELLEELEARFYMERYADSSDETKERAQDSLLKIKSVRNRLNVGLANYRTVNPNG